MLMDFIWTILIGLGAGWSAGYLLQGRGFGWPANLIVGLLGALLGGIVFPLLGLVAFGLIGRLLMATAGAIGVLFIAAWLMKPKGRLGGI